MIEQFYWTIDETLADSSTPNQSEPRYNCNEGTLRISHTPRLEPYHWMEFNVIARTLQKWRLWNYLNRST